MLGDVVGKPGRQGLARRLPAIVAETGASLVVANGENAAGGLGLTPETAEELLALPVAVLTSGNHIWKHRELQTYLDSHPQVIRPANYPEGTPGRGWTLTHDTHGVPVAVVNLQGLLFIAPLPCPFRTMDRLLAEVRAQAAVVVVDFHAEATSEKRALGHYLDGRVTAVVGTHTHIPTADAEVLPGGTGYLTDLGMCGPTDSVIGVEKEPAIQRFLSALPHPFQVASGRVRIQGALIRADADSGRCLGIEQRSWVAD
ncbi:MAG TPA: TIGR00282 family metallophosphoesterase [Myxococcota bacterium]|nr:TIGR00282 family metallophosphoesterase [Myxococcota bacterium]HRY96535.1 TIGR00282 family metallophosphoesterase [Myxococcota bacterium]